MTTALIRRNAPPDSCHNVTALLPRCTKTSFLLTPHYICVHRNSDSLHNAAFIEYSLVGWRLYCGLMPFHRSSLNPQCVTRCQVVNTILFLIPSPPLPGGRFIQRLVVVWQRVSLLQRHTEESTQNALWQYLALSSRWLAVIPSNEACKLQGRGAAPELYYQ